MITGVVLSALAILLFWFAPKDALMLLGRVLQGAAAAAPGPRGCRWSRCTIRRAGRDDGLFADGQHRRLDPGPGPGGGLYEVGGYVLPLIVAGVLVAVDAALRIFVLPPTGAAPNERGAAGLLLDRSVLIPAAAVALAAIGWGIVEPLLPVDGHPA